MIKQPSFSRICFVCFSHALGGLELSTLRLAEGMTEHGLAVTLVVPPDSPLEQRAVASGLTVRAMAPRWKYGDLGAALRLGRLFSDERIERVVIMRSQDIHLCALGSRASRSSKLVFYQQMQSGHDKRDVLHTWSFSKLSLWISLTPNMRRNVLLYTRMNPEKVAVVPLGANLTNFDPSRHRKDKSVRSFRLPKNKLLVGVLGRFDVQKGQEILLRAAPEVLRKHPNVHFVLAGEETRGEPGYRDHLHSLAASLGIGSKVTFLPFTEEVARFMAALDIFVLPSFAETYGLVVIEAMAMKLPVVATNAGGVPEIIRDGETGLLVEPRDVSALAGAIHRLAVSRALRVHLGLAARKEALAKYDMRVCIDNLIRALSSL